MEIEFYTKNVYGKEMIYLAEGFAPMWYRLTGKKTITESEMHSLTDLTGATFKRVFEPTKAPVC